MKRTLAFCLLLTCSGAVLAASPSASTQTETDAAIQQRMAALQTRMNNLANRMAALSAKIGDEASASALQYLGDSRRGMLGIATRDENGGTTVVAVSPGSPAERAGVEVGDVINAINARSIAFHGKTPTDDLAHLQVGEPVELTVLRNGKTLHLKATPERFSSDDWRATMRAAERAAHEARSKIDTPEFRKQIQQSIDDAMKSADVAREAAIKAGRHNHSWVVFTSPWWGLNLAPLNPELGHYFGTDNGVLVLSRNGKQFPELQPGDVITKVGGKSVAEPEDVQRALRGAADDKRVRIALRRRGKTITLAMKVPPRWNLLPPPPPQAPPAVPAAPPAPPSPVSPPRVPAPPAAPPRSGM